MFLNLKYKIKYIGGTMKIEEFITEIKLIINNELYQSNLISYDKYEQVVQKIGKKNDSK